ncbi:hypothetical protein [Novosphingobium sp.]|uniref:hypothetical protein n=1 Tax=Novosphingobium sp. TaxID=1874826 RepID=UPI003704BB9C
MTVTCLLALFASGQDWGAQAQVDAIEAKNRMIAAEREKLGTKQIVTSIAVRKAPDSGGFGEAAGASGAGDSGGGGAAGASVAPQSTRQRPEITGHIPIYPGANPKPGTTVTVKGVPAELAPGAKPKAKTKLQTGVVSAEQSSQIKETSRQRTGVSEGND